MGIRQQPPELEQLFAHDTASMHTNKSTRTNGGIHSPVSTTDSSYDQAARLFLLCTHA